MDILTHALSGIAAGTIFAGLSDNGAMEKLKVIALSGFGGALPDIDAISLWSKFDCTIGKVMALPPGKVIYSSKFWYSHHGFMHSVLAGFLLSLVLLLIQRYFTKRSFIFKNKWQVPSAFLAGYIMHLLGDLPTPGGPWNGIRLFFPSGTYAGGTGQTWWWNNYDVFLITITVIAINLTLLSIMKLARTKARMLLIVFLTGFLVCTIQLNRRNFDFNNPTEKKDYGYMEIKSKEIQRKILGEHIYKIMVKFDSKLKINF